MDITSPLRLAVGSHGAGSGKGCAMNVISWESGDTTITDAPPCADYLLAVVVQHVNDYFCWHRDGDMLCPPCSVEVLALAHRTVGSALSPSATAPRWVYARLARDEVESIDPDSFLYRSALLNAASASATGGLVSAVAAYRAHQNANRYAALSLPLNGRVPDVEMRRAHDLIDRCESLTGVRAQPVAPEVTATALAAMACPTP